MKNVAETLPDNQKLPHHIMKSVYIYIFFYRTTKKVLALFQVNPFQNPILAILIILDEKNFFITEAANEKKYEICVRHF